MYSRASFPLSIILCILISSFQPAHWEIWPFYNYTVQEGKALSPISGYNILYLPVPLHLSHNRTSFSLLLLPLPLSHTYFCLSLSLLPLGSVTIFMMWIDLLIIHHIRSSTLLIYISAYLLHGSCSYIHETKTYLAGPDKLYCNPWTALFRAY